MTSCCIPQLSFSFYQHRAIRADFSGGQITSDAGLLPLRAFDERHHLTCDWAGFLDDPRREESVRHDALALLRQRVYQIVAGYEDANDADRLRHDPALQIVADQKLGDPLGSQPTLSRWENAPSARSLVHRQFPGLPDRSGHRLLPRQPPPAPRRQPHFRSPRLRAGLIDPTAKKESAAHPDDHDNDPHHDTPYKNDEDRPTPSDVITLPSASTDEDEHDDEATAPPPSEPDAPTADVLVCQPGD